MLLTFPVGTPEEELRQSLEAVGGVQTLEYLDEDNAYCTFTDRADVRRCIDTLDQQVVGPGRFSVERMPPAEWKGIVAEARAEASVGTKSELLAQVRQGLGVGEPQIIRVEQTPKLTAFTGGSDDFDAWEYEVQGLLADGRHEEATLREAVRKSLKGDAARVLRSLGRSPSVTQILDKLRGIYGPVDTGSDLLERFCRQVQGGNETVSDWGCRLERLMTQVRESGQLTGDPELLLRSRFWKGLYSDRLREATRFRAETISDFDRLRVEARKTEQELADRDGGGKGRKLQTQGQVTDVPLSMFEALQRRVAVLEARLAEGDWNRRGRAPIQDGDQRASPAAAERGDWNRRERAPIQDSNQRVSSAAAGRDKTVPIVGKGNGDLMQEDIICFRCGQPGHIARGCRSETLNRSSGLKGVLPKPKGRE